ncbi:MAG TPA: hypothetical protein VGW31_07955, partial [Hanamia sp.]|nr:hypothetical protein [Hanamia sp.]
SPFTIHHSQFTIDRSPFTPFTIHNNDAIHTLWIIFISCYKIYVLSSQLKPKLKWNPYETIAYRCI